MFLKPFGHRFLQFASKFDQLLDVVLGRDANHVVLDGIPLVPAFVEVRRVVLPRFAQDDGKGFEGALMSLRRLRAISRRVEQDRAAFQRRVVGNAKAPVRRSVAFRIKQVALDDF